MNQHHNVIVSSSFLKDWYDLDNTWRGRFLEEAGKLLSKMDSADLTKKVCFFLFCKVKDNSLVDSHSEIVGFGQENYWACHLGTHSNLSVQVS